MTEDRFTEYVLSKDGKLCKIAPFETRREAALLRAKGFFGIRGSRR
jgi:hypothetical protein